MSSRLLSGFVVTDAASLGRRLTRMGDGEVDAEVGVEVAPGGGSSSSRLEAMEDATAAHWPARRLVGANVTGSEVCICVHCVLVWDMPVVVAS